MPDPLAPQRRGGRADELRLLASLSCTYLAGSITATASTIFLVQRFGIGLSSGLAIVLLLVPNLLLGPLAGELVVRIKPKPAAMAGSLGTGVVVLGYLLVTQAWQAQLVSLLVGLAGVLGIPARMALRASVLSTERLKTSTGAIIASERLGLVLGPLVATSVTVAIQVEAAFVLEFFLALIAVGTLAGLHPREADYGTPTSAGLRGIYRSAWQLMSRNRVISEYSLTGFTYSVGTGIRRLLFPAALVVALSSTESRLGVLTGAIALGGIVGGLLAPRVRTEHVDRQYLLQSAAEMTIWLALGLVSSLPLYAGLLILAGVLEGSTTTLYFIRVQEELHANEIGRYFSLMSPITDASIAIGVLMASGLGVLALAQHGSWMIAALIGAPFLICRGILRGALRPADNSRTGRSA